MRITRTNKEANYYRLAEKSANRGCLKCPCCGEKKTWFDYAKKGILNRGVSKSLVTIDWTEGIISRRKMRRNIYGCRTCGAQWQSDPYPYETV